MSKKEFRKDIYNHKFQLLFEGVLHRKIKNSSVVKDEEKERLKLIADELAELNNHERISIYRDYLRLFSTPYQDVPYYIIPREMVGRHIAQAVAKFNKTQRKIKTTSHTASSSKTEKTEIVNQEKPVFRNTNKHLKVDKEKKLLNSKKEFSGINEKNQDVLLNFPDIETYKPNNKKDDTTYRLRGNLNPVKKILKVTLTERNRHLVNSLKELYENRCQVCNDRLQVGYKKYYSEVHHIRPLGKHGGPDTLDNMIVVCPNHHTLFDRGAISIDVAEKKVTHFSKQERFDEYTLILKHQINPIYIDYHNKNIFLKSAGYNIVSRKVDYNDIVIFTDGEDIEEVRLENFFNRGLMNNMQRMLLNKSEGEAFIFNGIEYKVMKIISQP
ncbi:HNH endonuclease [Planococcus sp. SIMBA_143]